MAWRSINNNEIIRAQFTDRLNPNHGGIRIRFGGAERSDRHVLIAGRKGQFVYVYGLNLAECLSVDIETQTFALHNPGYRWYEEIPQGQVQVDTDVL